MIQTARVRHMIYIPTYIWLNIYNIKKNLSLFIIMILIISAYILFKQKFLINFVLLDYQI